MLELKYGSSITNGNLISFSQSLPKGESEVQGSAVNIICITVSLETTQHLFVLASSGGTEMMVRSYEKASEKTQLLNYLGHGSDASCAYVVLDPRSTKPRSWLANLVMPRPMNEATSSLPLKYTI